MQHECRALRKDGILSIMVDTTYSSCLIKWKKQGQNSISPVWSRLRKTIPCVCMLVFARKPRMGRSLERYTPNHWWWMSLGDGIAGWFSFSFNFFLNFFVVNMLFLWFKKDNYFKTLSRDFVAAQGLRRRLLVQGVQVRLLVRELSHIPHGQKTKTKSRSNIVTNSIKTLKIVHI